MILGIFDFIPEIGYSFTKGLLKIIDMISKTMNKISGIDTITIKGEEEDFLTYLLTSNDVQFAFGVAAVLGFILLMLFTVAQIAMSYARDKQEESPVQIVKKAAKNLLILLLVPTFMYLFVILSNAFMKAMYQATMNGESSLPQFMFEIFAQDALTNKDSCCAWDSSNSTLWSYMDLWDFSFIYSWLISALVIYFLLKTALMLVERCISIVFLYLSAPFVVASAVMDDGGKFKSWRDQVAIKFLTAQGAVIAINVYLLVVKLVISSDVKFFDSDALNGFIKLLFIVGGAFSLKQVQAIVGNLIQAGAGDRAVAENDRATAMTQGLLGGALHAGAKVASSPFKAARGLSNFNRDRKEYYADSKGNGGWGAALGHALGFKGARDYGKQSRTSIAEDREREKRRMDVRNGGEDRRSTDEKVNDALTGNNQSNLNNKQTETRGQSMVNNAIAGNNEIK